MSSVRKKKPSRSGSKSYVPPVELLPLHHSGGFVPASAREKERGPKLAVFGIEKNGIDESEERRRRSRSPSRGRGRGRGRGEGIGMVYLHDTDGTVSWENRDAFDDDGERRSRRVQSEALEEELEGVPYFTLIISIVQGIILLVSLSTCLIAPLSVNPTIGPWPGVLDEWGGKNSFKILKDGELWRLFMPTLLHAGVLHFMCNVAIQMDACWEYELIWGTKKYAALYIMSGVGGILTSMAFKPGLIGVGASGAILGVVGGRVGEGIVTKALWDCGRKHRRPPHLYESYKSMRKELMWNLISVTFILLLSFLPYVDWPCHLGGLLTGLTISLCYFLTRIDSGVTWYKNFWLLVVLVVCIFFTAYLLIVFSLIFTTDFAPYDYLEDICGYYEKYYDDNGGDGDQDQEYCECTADRFGDTVNSIWSWLTTR